MAHIDRQPAQEVFDDIKKCVKQVWQRYDNTYGYVDEKLDRIDSVTNYADNWWTFLGMLDDANKVRALSLMQDDTLRFLEIQEPNYTMFRIPFELTRNL